MRKFIYLIIGLLLGIILFKGLVFGAVQFDRSPTDNEISCPFNLSGSFDILDIPPTADSYRVEVGGLYSQFLGALENLDFSLLVSNSGGDISCPNSGNVSWYIIWYSGGDYVSTTNSNDGFIIIGSDHILSIPESGAGDLLAYVGRLLDDLWLIVALPMGLYLSFYVIKRVIQVVKLKKDHKNY